jgi:hypothetical protein
MAAATRYARSDSGSRMGVAESWQVRSEAATVAGPQPLTCGNVVELWFRRLVRFVRDEEAAG